MRQEGSQLQSSTMKMVCLHMHHVCSLCILITSGHISQFINTHAQPGSPHGMGPYPFGHDLEMPRIQYHRFILLPNLHTRKSNPTHNSTTNQLATPTHSFSLYIDLLVGTIPLER
jgi:hypothetical protein